MSDRAAREEMCVCFKASVVGSGLDLKLRDVFEYCSLLDLYDSDNVLEGRDMGAMLIKLTQDEQSILKGTGYVAVEPQAHLNALPAHDRFGFEG